MVYIASHGCLKTDDNDEPVACLVASDTPKKKEDKNKTYLLASLAKLFETADVNNLVGIFDFCHAGAITDLIEEVEASFKRQKIMFYWRPVTPANRHLTPKKAVFSQQYY